MTTKLNSAQLRGIFPAIPTPVRDNDTIDTEAARALLRYLLPQGVSGIVPIGGTGEYGAMGREERVRMVALTAEEVNGRVPVIPGILDPGFHDALAAGKALADAGANALMVLTPYYTNPTQQGVRDYYMRYADASPVPVLLYEIPYRTRIAINPEIIHELSRHENIIGMKACNLDMYHFLKVQAGIDHSSFTVLSGEDSLFPLQLAAGAKGGILVTASMLPRTWGAIHDLAVSGKTAEAIALHKQLIPMMDMTFAETNPGPMKSVMDLIGVTAPRVLAPLVQPAGQLQERLRAEMQKCLAAEARLATA